MADARLRASRIRGLIAAENEAWDRATEQRAMLNMPLSNLKESEDRQDLSEDEAEERCEQLRAMSSQGSGRGTGRRARLARSEGRAEAKIKDEEAEEQAAMKRARRLVEENWLAVVAVADALLRKRTPERTEFLEIQQVRWITWKLGQDGSSRIKVDVERQSSNDGRIQATDRAPARGPRHREARGDRTPTLGVICRRINGAISPCPRSSRRCSNSAGNFLMRGHPNEIPSPTHPRRLSPNWLACA